MANTKGELGPDWATFTGYQSPNYTNVPDQLFDEHLAFLSGAELKVLLYIIRRTFGFKKDADNISLGQMLNGITTRDGHRLDYGVGLTKKTLLQALRDLQDKHLIIAEQRQSVERGNEPTRYSLNLNGNTLGVKTPPPLGEKLHQGGGEEIPPSPRGKNYTTQETVIQETELQNTDISLSNIRKPSRSHIEDQARDEAGGSGGVSPAPTGSFGTSDPLQEAKDQPAITWTPRPQNPSESPSRGFQRVGDLIDHGGRNNGATGRTTRQKPYSEDRQRILAYIEDFAIEMGDEAPLPSSVSRAYNLFVRSGADISAFTSLMYEARALTKEYTANITKTKSGKSGPFGPQKNKMAYFFSILESRLGLTGQLNEPT